MNVKMKIKIEMTVVVRKEGNRSSRVEHLNCFQTTYNFNYELMCTDKETKRWNRYNSYWSFIIIEVRIFLHLSRLKSKYGRNKSLVTIFLSLLHYIGIRFVTNYLKESAIWVNWVYLERLIKQGKAISNGAIVFWLMRNTTKYVSYILAGTF